MNGVAPNFNAAALESETGLKIQRILKAALSAVDPYSAVKNCLEYSGNILGIGKLKIDISHLEHVSLIAFGKASYPMAAAVLDKIGPIVDNAIVVTKDGHDQAYLLGKEKYRNVHFKHYLAGHPVPDERSCKAAHSVLQRLQKCAEDDLVLVLVSGGGSALLTSPIPPLTIQDMQDLTGKLLASGANIHKINTLRKHLDQVKGGGLARAARPARVVSLILSDVVGDDLDVIASGPTVPDPSTYRDAGDILSEYGMQEMIPANIRARIADGLEGKVKETPKPGDACFNKVSNIIVGNNSLALEAAAAQARSEGLQTLILTSYLQGEASQAGKFFGAVARQIAKQNQPLKRPCCILAGGETTVTLKGNGLGGRNQEMALGALEDMAGLRGAYFVTLASDGGDGPTDAAGAVVTSDSLARAKSMGLNPATFLACNDTYHFFESLNDLMKPGPTQTNVNDLCLLLMT